MLNNSVEHWEYIRWKMPEIRLEVERHAKGLKPVPSGRAIDYSIIALSDLIWDKREDYWPTTLKQILAMAQRIQVGINKGLLPDSAEPELEPVLSIPEDDLNALAFAERVEPYIRSIRQKIFGSEEAPFNSEGEATSWLLSDAAEDNYPTKKWMTNKRTFFMPSGKEDRFATPVHTYAGGFLYWEPINAAKKIAHETGWKEEDALMYILLGTIPQLPRTCIKVNRHQDEFDRRLASIDIYDSELTRDELYYLHSKLREHLGVKRQRSKKKRHELVLLVKHIYNTQTFGNAEEFWELCASLWYKKTGEKTNRQSLQVRYSNACKKLGEHPIDLRKKRRGK